MLTPTDTYNGILQRFDNIRNNNAHSYNDLQLLDNLYKDVTDLHNGVLSNETLEVSEKTKLSNAYLNLDEKISTLRKRINDQINAVTTLDYHKFDNDFNKLAEENINYRSTSKDSNVSTICYGEDFNNAFLPLLGDFKRITRNLEDFQKRMGEATQMFMETASECDEKTNSILTFVSFDEKIVNLLNAMEPVSKALAEMDNRPIAEQLNDLRDKIKNYNLRFVNIWIVVNGVLARFSRFDSDYSPKEIYYFEDGSPKESQISISLLKSVKFQAAKLKSEYT